MKLRASVNVLGSGHSVMALSLSGSIEIPWANTMKLKRHLILHERAFLKVYVQPVNTKSQKTLTEVS